MEQNEQENDWPSAEMKASSIAQAKALREQAKQGGLRFEAYLPPRLAEWLLGVIEEGTFISPSEAVFVFLGEHQELVPHADLRRELLKRRVQSAIDDPRPSISTEAIDKKMRTLVSRPRPEPAVWQKQQGK